MKEQLPFLKKHKTKCIAELNAADRTVLTKSEMNELLFLLKDAIVHSISLLFRSKTEYSIADCILQSIVLFIYLYLLLFMQAYLFKS